MATEHLLKQFAYTNVISTRGFENDLEIAKKVMMDHAVRDLSRQHLTIQSFAWQDRVMTDWTDDGTELRFMEVALVGLAHRLDESAEQSVRKLDIDEARRG